MRNFGSTVRDKEKSKGGKLRHRERKGLLPFVLFLCQDWKVGRGEEKGKKGAAGER